MPAVPSKAAVGMKASDIQACMRKNLVDRAALRDLTITSTDREGKSHDIKVKLYWKPGANGQVRVNLRLVAPQAIAGSSYLLLQKGDKEVVYFYLPGAARAVQLEGDSLSEPMWNTDFSYNEIKEVMGLIAAGTTARSSDVTVAGRPAFALQTLTNVDEDSGTYTRVNSAVDQASCTLLRSEFYVKGAEMTKLLEADTSTLMAVDTYSVILRYTMRDQRSGTHTTVDLSDFTLLERMPEKLFDPEHFFEPFE
jgi:outer membrane lipoprotein-sorting protein